MSMCSGSPLGTSALLPAVFPDSDAGFAALYRWAAVHVPMRGREDLTSADNWAARLRESSTPSP